MGLYDYEKEQIQKWWESSHNKKTFMEQIGILNRDYRALKRVMNFYHLDVQDLGKSLIDSNYKLTQLKEDKTGYWYGDLEVIGIDTIQTSRHKRPYYECYCHKCQKKVTKRADALTTAIQDCGCENAFKLRVKQSIDLTGQIFNDLLVLELDKEETRKHERFIYWKCQCLRCQNNTITTTTESLKTGNTTSCGCKQKESLQRRRKDLSHQYFGWLEAIEVDEQYTEDKHKKNAKDSCAYWKCYCHACNSYLDKPVRSSDLIQNKRVSCGCLKISYGESKIKSILDNLSINYKQQYSFSDCLSIRGNRLYFDFAILNDKGEVQQLIEFNGRQHYETVEYFGGEQNFLRQVENDNKKVEYCKEYNLPLLVISYKNQENIEQVLKKELSFFI